LKITIFDKSKIWLIAKSEVLRFKTLLGLAKRSKPLKNRNLKMKSEEKLSRLKFLRKKEVELKNERNFVELIKLFDESMMLFDSIGNITERVPQKAYCLARIGKKEEAEKSLEKLKEVSFFADQDELFRAITLVSFFLQIDDISELNQMQINTLKKWLQDPDASKQVIQVVFDYSDIIENITPFDSSRLQTKQTKFSNELLNCIFSSMQRNNDTVIYYNKEKNDVQQEVEGYLTSHLAEDQTVENRRLSQRIMNSDPTDNIIEGIHFLIPRLKLVDFLSMFEEKANNYPILLEFIENFKVSILSEYGNYIESIDELSYSVQVSESFYKELDDWYKRNDFEIYKLKSIISETQNQLSTKYLLQINNIEY